MLRLGVVSFLNARPLIEGLATEPRVSCVFCVPADLPEQLAGGAVDAALIPLVDVLRGRGRFGIVSDACIACDGETMTVRVFSQVPPDRVDTLWADADSHTSVALARVLWRELYGRDLRIEAFDARVTDPGRYGSVLLIGDKVVDPRRAGFAYEVDLGGAWRQHTGLPFVFAVWAVRAAPESAALSDRAEELARLLGAARDRGVRRAAAIARAEGPAHGWPAALAERYLARCLSYTLDARAVAGAERFARHCAALGLVPADAALTWPAGLCDPNAQVTP